MIIADYHVHSNFSSDGKASMEEMIQAAIRLGLTKICFTDHMDYDYPQMMEGYNFEFNISDYIEKLNELKLHYRGQLEILAGIELGLQPHLADRLNQLVQSHPFDFFIGSSHVVNKVDPFYPQYWEKRTTEEGIQAYFESIIDNCKAFLGFHVYGHIDYIIRYIPDRSKAQQKITYSYRDYADVLDEVLKTIISYGKGIEVNTAGLKYGLGFPHPKLEVLKRYRELGGEIITVGSDAHRPEHLAYQFDCVPDLLKSIGFRYYTTFQGGKPIFEKL
jgi:histidinol-phosphatase (PHP family)